MCGCCSDIKENHSVRKTFILLTIIVNIALTLFFIITNILGYEKYKNRASYVVYHVPNTTSDYYIIRADLNGTLNCSTDALFTFDIRHVFLNIISKHGTLNTLFIAVFWLSLIVAILVSLFGIILSIRSFCNDDESDNDDAFLFKMIRLVGSQFLQKGAFIFPTYFIGVFDYTQLCLPHHTKASLFVLHHTYLCIFMSLFSMVYLIVWTWACWDTRRQEYNTNEHPKWVKCIECITCDNHRISLVIFILLLLVVVMVGVYGIFVWIISLMETLLTTKAVLIFFHFIIGVLHDIINLIKHYFIIIDVEAKNCRL